MEREMQKLAEGREAEIFAWEDGTVLRLLHNPDAQQQVEWEARAMRVALAAGVSVPAVHGTTTVQGRPGLIMERIDGLDLLALVGRRPWAVLSIGKTSGQLHARLHEVSAPDSLPALKASLAARIEASDLVPRRLAEFAISALHGLPDGDRLCHGDFHPGNIMLSNGEPVLIDWTNVTRGDPNADFVRTNLMLRIGEPPPGSTALLRALAQFGARFGRSILLSAYLRAYRRARTPDAALVEQWEVPVAANRLAEDVEGERTKLLSILEARLAANG